MSELIPKSKHDYFAVLNIKRASTVEIEKVLDDILKWLQDPNWPIFVELLEALSKIDGAVLAPHVEKLFLENPNDYDWKISLLNLIYNNEILAKIMAPNILFLATNPNKYETLYEMDKLAEEILVKYQIDKPASD